MNILRENTEGFYADRNMFLGSGEFMPTEDVALSAQRTADLGGTTGTRAFGAAVVAQLEKTAERLAQTA